MTVTKEVIHAIVNKFGDNVQPNDARPTVDKEVMYKEDVHLVSFDSLGQLRSTTIDWVVCPITGRRTRMTCRKFFEKVFNMTVFLALLMASVRVVVVCIDRYGARRVEKTATTMSRKRRRADDEPDYIPLPPGQRRYFGDDLPMPCELTDIFEDAHIKAEFYEYLTMSFTSVRTQHTVPAGKRLIFSGAVRLDAETQEVRHLFPMEVTRTEVREMVECDNSGISEGDLDAWYWPVYVFPEMNVHVHSYDSDVLFVGMMQIRRLLRENPDRKVWFITRRSTQSREATERDVRRRTTKEQQRIIAFDATLAETQGDVAEARRVAGKMYSTAASSSSSSQVAVTAATFKSLPVWTELFFNVAAICTLLYKEANERLEHRNMVMRNPVEVNVLALILSSQKHDYIQPRALSPGAGAQLVWPAFTESLWKFNELVTLMTNDDDEYFYAVSVAGLKALAVAIYDMKGSQTIRDKNMPCVETLHKLAAQCAWTMQYWGNGIKPGYHVIDGTTIDDESGRSIYGYTSGGWALSVNDDLDDTAVRYCPPIALDTA